MIEKTRKKTTPRFIDLLNETDASVKKVTFSAENYSPVIYFAYNLRHRRLADNSRKTQNSSWMQNMQIYVQETVPKISERISNRTLH